MVNEEIGMLVITREAGQAVVLRLPDGREIVLSVVKVQALAGRVRIGLRAPADVRIYREELLVEGGSA